MSATEHFTRRVRERLGPEHDADALRRWIIGEIRHGSDEIEFMGRLNRHGRRLWRFFVEGRPVIVVFSHTTEEPITILTEDTPIRCGSRGQKRIINGVSYVV